MSSLTIAQAFDAAIAAEQTAEKLFRGLQAKFAPHEEIAAFWEHYAEEEGHHAEYLRRLRAKQPPEGLAGPADAQAAGLIEAVNEINVEKLLAEVHDLEEAYQLVHNIESGETNAIFQFILSNFETDANMAKFLRSQLSAHVARLTIDLPARYKGAPARRAIKALADES